MQIETAYFGEVTIDEDKMITFKDGLPGLESHKKFALFPVDEEGMYFALQSVTDKEIALVVTSPYVIHENYDFYISEGVQKEVEIEKPEDVVVYNILTLREPFVNSTVNLQAPIVIHKDKRKARQVILNDEKYSIRHPLFQKGSEADARSE
ncbi:flagellar assembly protein FliW [Salimicrobium halophilum]|uniref:Flagellar assembly factor FliW n=1 Tax=Salimicrobium halophilum TaxID=86666 RepID=A0A1G8RZG7_9BACI|nr:flagellar assembly protein FliW [Salimicrobium halophilum]SDJ22311.1 flagellar assembly factor FliW [Salimicrobium halophilum]